MHRYIIRHEYAAWVADDGLGSTIWALTREDLLATAANIHANEEIVRVFVGGAPC